jgi:hypothetical protein
MLPVTSNIRRRWRGGKWNRGLNAESSVGDGRMEGKWNRRLMKLC